jgi:hypothetical protein
MLDKQGKLAEIRQWERRPSYASPCSLTISWGYNEIGRVSHPSIVFD